MSENVLKEVGKLGFGLARALPQVKDEKVAYYISGSLAMLLLSLAKNITPYKLSASGEIVGAGEQEIITEKQKSALLKGVRKIGGDLDIVEVAGNEIPYTGAIQKSLNVDMKKLSTSCFSALGLDALSETRVIGAHNVALIENEQGQCVFITSPVDLLLHKASELVMLIGKLSSQDLSESLRENIKKKAEKDISDFSSMFNAVVEMKMYPKDIALYMQEIKENGTEFSTKNTSQNVFNGGCENFLSAVMPFIDQNHHETLKEFVDALPNVQENTDENTL